MCLDNFIKNLRYLRKKHGSSQPFIAEKCNKKSYTTIQKWETGGAEPSLKDVLLLSKIYGVGIDEFVKEDLEMKDCLPKADSNNPKTKEESLVEDFRKLNSEGQKNAAKIVKSFTTDPDYAATSQEEEAARSSA